MCASLLLLSACAGGPDKHAAAHTDVEVHSDADVVDTDRTGHTDVSAHTGSGDTDPTDSDAPESDLPSVDGDGDGAPAGPDCDDADPAVHPGAREVCNRIDDDCDRAIDDADGDVHADGTGAVRFFLDADGDGFGTDVAIWACVDPGSGWTDVDGDCDDIDASISPSMPEVCSGVDDDCDGFVDALDPDIHPALLKVVFHDGDGDGFGDAATPGISCGWPTGPWVIDATDCDDTSRAVNPSVREVPYDGIDQDCDGVEDCDLDGDGADAAIGACAGTDCDDANTGIHPGVPERCNDLDDDCDGLIDLTDPDLVAVGTDLWRDADADGFGDPAGFQRVCGNVRPGWVADGTDCDDADPRVNPSRPEVPYNGVDDDCDGTDACDVDGDGADALACGGDDCADGDASRGPGVPEICDGVDDDCDGLVDTDDPDLDASGLVTYYRDLDGDGAGDPAVSAQGCGQLVGSWSRVAGDCDDTRADLAPNRAEVPYDGIDQDCSGADLCDVDGDGVAAALGACGGEDCADDDPTRGPGAPEFCDGVDGDCDHLADVDDPDVDPAAIYTMFLDADGDGAGDPAVPARSCEPDPEGFAPLGDDCDDGDPLVAPRNDEVCDGHDDDCDGLVDDDDPDVRIDDPWYLDDDADGFVGLHAVVFTCTRPPTGGSYDEDAVDCDDADPDTFPGAAELDTPTGCRTDADGDGYGAQYANSQVPAGTDCDDTDASTFPGAAELDSVTACSRDLDGDGYGDVTQRTGRAPGRDCADADPFRHPGVTEICDAVDNDCDGALDDADPDLVGGTSGWVDFDGDGWPSAVAADAWCVLPPGFVDAPAHLGARDCADADDATFPGAAEAESATACRTDADEDGYGAYRGLAPGVDHGDDCVDHDADTSPAMAPRESSEGCRTDVDRDGYGDKAPYKSVIDPGTDCDDDSANTFPGAAEHDSRSLCMLDADDDGWGSSAAPPGTSPGTDCDDTSSDTFVGAAERESSTSCRRDVDHDGYGSTSVPVGVTAGTDCDDASATTYVGAAQREDTGSCRADADEDGYGASIVPDGVTAGGDCDDADPAFLPGGEVWYDGLDQGCDGGDDWDRDADGTADRSKPDGTGTDCDDADAAIHVGAVEVCDAIDNDCDLAIDDDDPDVVVSEPWGVDLDVDQFPDVTTLIEVCVQPAPGTVRYEGLADCDDDDPLTFPGAADAESPTLCMTDADADGWGGDSVVDGVVPGTDCDDLDPAVCPGVAEIWYDGVDERCDDGDDWDGDGDGWQDPSALGGEDCDDHDPGAYPGAFEIQGDGIDQDCDGVDLCPTGAAAACPYASCAAARDDGMLADGLVWVAQGQVTPYQVWCDQTHDGGGWTLAAIVSDDGDDAWTDAHRTWWAVSTVLTGSPADLVHDFRGPAMFRAPMTDVLFVHAPSGVWAAYGGVDSGTRSLGAWLGGYGINAQTCWGTTAGLPMTAGTLTTGGSRYALCTTDLYVSPAPQDGSTGCSGIGTDGIGPAWSVGSDATTADCPMVDPVAHSGLGGRQECHDLVCTDVESTALGFGEAQELNTGAPGTGENRMSVFVR